jgi:oligopeptide transport system substrate-binding protein
VPGFFETDAYAYDPVKARLALASSSYGGPEGLPEIIWHYSSEPGQKGLTSRVGAEWLAAQYRAVLGVELTLVPLSPDEWSPLIDNPATRPQILDWGWFQDYPDPQDWLSVYWTCNSTVYASLAGYCNPEFDALVARADAEPDPEDRLALYEEAGRLLVADVPSAFLYVWEEAWLVQPYVTGYTTTAMDVWPGWSTPLTIDVERQE